MCQKRQVLCSLGNVVLSCMIHKCDIIKLTQTVLSFCLKHAHRHTQDHAQTCTRYRTYSNPITLVLHKWPFQETPPWTIPFISTRKHLGRVQLLTDLKSVFSTDLRAVRKPNWSQMRRATVEDAAGSAACRLDFTGVGRNVGNSRANTSMLRTKWLLPNLTILKSHILWSLYKYL